jgi:hypothetical protein
LMVSRYCEGPMSPSVSGGTYPESARVAPRKLAETPREGDGVAAATPAGLTEELNFGWTRRKRGATRGSVAVDAAFNSAVVRRTPGAPVVGFPRVTS